MFVNETCTINGINVTLLCVDTRRNTAIYYARGPFKDYYIRRVSTRRFDIEGYEDRWIDEASTLEEACQIILEWDEENIQW